MYKFIDSFSLGRMFLNLPGENIMAAGSGSGYATRAQLAGLVVSNPLMISGTGIDVGSARLRHEFACLK